MLTTLFYTKYDKPCRRLFRFDKRTGKTETSRTNEVCVTFFSVEYEKSWASEALPGPGRRGLLLLRLSGAAHEP